MRQHFFPFFRIEVFIFGLCWQGFQLESSKLSLGAWLMAMIFWLPFPKRTQKAQNIGRFVSPLANIWRLREIWNEIFIIGKRFRPERRYLLQSKLDGKREIMTSDGSLSVVRYWNLWRYFESSTTNVRSILHHSGCVCQPQESIEFHRYAINEFHTRYQVVISGPRKTRHLTAA